MGPDSVQYMTESYNYAQDPDLKAKGIDLSVWNNDITANSQLQKIFNVVEPLYFDISDMMHITGSEAMDAAQANYRFLRFGAEEGEPKARVAYEALKKLRWDRPSKKSTNASDADSK